MALKSTIFKASLSIADMDRGYYADHTLTIARHPSENDERMMVRLLAFALNASAATAFGRGLSDPDEPDVVTRDLTGAIEHWIEVGQPDARAILKACGKASRVTVLAYAAATAIWWRTVQPQVARARNLAVLAIPSSQSLRLASLARRAMQLHCSIQDHTAWIGDGGDPVELPLEVLQWPAAGIRSP